MNVTQSSFSLFFTFRFPIFCFPPFVSAQGGVTAGTVGSDVNDDDDDDDDDDGGAGAGNDDDNDEAEFRIS